MVHSTHHPMQPLFLFGRGIKRVQASIITIKRVSSEPYMSGSYQMPSQRVRNFSYNLNVCTMTIDHLDCSKLPLADAYKCNSPARILSRGDRSRVQRYCGASTRRISHIQKGSNMSKEMISSYIMLDHEIPHLDI
jgi:hypothetical protein